MNTNKVIMAVWRTRNTVSPYLKGVDAKGEIWPELHEFGGGSKILTTDLPAVLSLANAQLWMVEQRPNWRFKLGRYNDAAYARNQAQPAPPP